MKCKNSYRDPEKYRAYKNRYYRKYYRKTAIYEKRHYTLEEENLVLAHEVSDHQLSDLIHHSVMSIQSKRSRLRKGKKMEIKVKYREGMEPIKQAHEGEWYDLRAAAGGKFKKGDFAYIDLGVCIELPEGYEAIVAPRSSTFKKYGLIQTNSIGIIDHSYCGDNDWWKMPVYCTRDIEIMPNERICQFRILYQQPKCDIVTVDSLGNEDRNGLGSTGRI